MTPPSTTARQSPPDESPAQDSLERRAAIHALRMARGFIQTHTWPTAIIWLKQAIKIQPEFFEAYYLLGDVYMKIGEVQSALETYEKAVGLRPNDANARLKLGGAYIALKDWNSALKQYHELRSLNEVVANDLFDKIVYSFNYQMFDDLFNCYQKAQ